MDLNFFPKSDQSANPIIQKDVDAAKYEEIATKLCIKRRTLENDLKKADLDPNLREEYALKLMDLKGSFGIFGISEIDYQAYLVKIENSGEEPVLQSSLF